MTLRDFLGVKTKQPSMCSYDPLTFCSSDNLTFLNPTACGGESQTQKVSLNKDDCHGKWENIKPSQAFSNRATSPQEIEHGGIAYSGWHLVPENLSDFRDGVLYHRKVTVWFNVAAWTLQMVSSCSFCFALARGGVPRTQKLRTSASLGGSRGLSKVSAF